jgi:NAD kinase
VFDKVVLVTRKTRLQELIERFNTRAQARFYLTHAGLDFDDYESEDDTYRRALDQVHRALPTGLKVQVLERALVPTYLFAPSDVVLAVGQDWLVANTARYVGPRPLLGVNPDPSRFDGVLLPFSPVSVRPALAVAVEGRAPVREVTLAQATLSDGQTLTAFNDLFIGARSHVSARYRLRVAGGQSKKSLTKKPAPAGGPWESQSSSGVIVSTGAGSTGWLSSVCAMASGVASFLGGRAVEPVRLAWEDPRLFFVVREPFVSRHSTAAQVAGFLSADAPLELESLLPQGGVIFGDGMEADALAFSSGLTARIAPAPQRAHLVVPLRD